MRTVTVRMRRDVQRSSMTLVTTTEGVGLLAYRARAAGIAAIDTEFVSNRAYFPKLGLVQVGLSTSDVTLVDPLSILDWDPLGALLADRKVVKVLHSPESDLSLLYRATGSAPANIFDTQRAAGFLGMPSTLSLSNLVGEFCNVSLDKSETRTNWLNRPLSSEQLAYAANDVRYLCMLYDRLSRRATLSGRQQWIAEEMQKYDGKPHLGWPDPAKEWLKFGRLRDLGGRQRAVLQALAAWRLKKAQTRDIPSDWVLSKEAAYAIAQRLPTRLHELSACGVSQKSLRNYGNSIMRIVHRHYAHVPPRPRGLPYSARFRATVRAARDLVTQQAAAARVDMQLIASKKDIARYVAGRGSPLRHGWRYECAGHALDGFLRSHEEFWKPARHP